MTEWTGEPDRRRWGALSRRAGGIAFGLLALAVLFAVLYRFENSRENHSYNSGEAPPFNVHVTLGEEYEISAPGGMVKFLAGGLLPSALNCNYTPVDGTQTLVLEVRTLPTDTRATHTLATFIAPVTGLVHIECRAIAATYIDDADDVGSDPAGLYLLLCTICLTLGAALGLSVLYRRGGGTPDRSGPGSDDAPSSGSADGDDYGRLLASPGDR